MDVAPRRGLAAALPRREEVHAALRHLEALDDVWVGRSHHRRDGLRTRGEAQRGESHVGSHKGSILQNGRSCVCQQGEQARGSRAARVCGGSRASTTHAGIWHSKCQHHTQAMLSALCGMILQTLQNGHAEIEAHVHEARW